MSRAILRPYIAKAYTREVLGLRVVLPCLPTTLPQAYSQTLVPPDWPLQAACPSPLPSTAMEFAMFAVLALAVAKGPFEAHPKLDETLDHLGHPDGPCSWALEGTVQRPLETSSVISISRAWLSPSFWYQIPWDVCRRWLHHHTIEA